MPGYTHGRRVEVTKKRKPETLREIIEPGPKRQNTAIQEAPVRQPSLLHEDERNERQAFTKQQSGLGDTKWRPEWWKGSKFKKELLELVGFPYLYKGKVCFAKWFELKKYGKHRAERYRQTVLPMYMTVVDASH